MAGVERACSALLALDSNHPGAWFIGAVCALEAGRLDQALSGLETATTLAPNRADYWTQYARCLAQLGRERDALRSVERALSLPIADALTHGTLGNVLTRLGRHGEAIEQFEAAAALEPDHAQVQYNVATALMFCGELERSKAAYERVLELDPDHGHSHVALVDFLDGAPEPGRIELLEAAFERSAGDVDRSLLTGHALARTLEAAGETGRAFAVWARTKGAKKSAVGYMIDQDRVIFSEFERLFPHVLDSCDATGDPSAAPIFICGMPRTGTTLLDRVLASHSAVVSAGETRYLPQAVKEASGSRDPRMIDTLTLANALKQDPAAIGRRYLELASMIVGIDGRFIDKLPLNFFFVGFIRLALPNARIICLRRNPLDTCIANFRQLFAIHFPYYRYALSLDDTIEYVVMFERLMAHWDEVFPGAICHVRYEDLVTDTEAEVRRVLGYLGLEFEPDVLNFEQNAAPVATASAVQVRRPIHRRSVGAWHRYGNELEAARQRLRSLGIDPGDQADQSSGVVD